MINTEIYLALLGLTITLVLTVIIQLVYYIINKSDERKMKQQNMIKNNNPLRTYNVTVSQTLSKTVKVETNEYVSMILQNPKTGELSEFDVVGHINWKEVFEEQHWDIASLLKVLKEYVKNDMINHTTDRGQRQLEALYLACDNWNEDEYEVIKE